MKTFLFSRSTNRHGFYSLAGLDQSRYFVPSISAPWRPENPSSVSPNWFTEDLRPELSCGITCNVRLTEDTTITELDERIAQGLVDPGVYTEPMRWMLERDLYRKLYANPELVYPQSLIDTFYTAKSSTTVGRFVAVEAAIHALFELDTATESQLQDYYRQITEQIEETGMIDSLLQTVTGQDSLDLLAQRIATLQVLDSLSQQMDSLLAAIQNARTLATAQLAADNAAIPASFVFELNERSVNDVFLETFASGIYTFDSLQQTTLENIAYQCPLTGGTAVFRARGLLSLLGEYDFGDDQLNCEGVENRSAQPAYLPIPETLVVFPNPGNGEFTVVLPAHTKGRLWITDTNGQVVYEHKLSGEWQLRLNLTHLPNGLYSCHIEADGAVSSTARLALIR